MGVGLKTFAALIGIFKTTVSHLHLEADELEALPLKATDDLTDLPMGTRLSSL